MTIAARKHISARFDNLCSFFFYKLLNVLQAALFSLMDPSF